MARAWIGVGANLGDPAAQVRAALSAIADLPDTTLLAQSALYRSEPLGPRGQPDYCNAVCGVETALEPLELMSALLAIERAAGRVRSSAKWGPRRLDLDLLHVEGFECQDAALTLPHPEIARRNFVLVPFAEIAPDVVLPELGSVSEAARAVGSRGLSRWQD